MEVLQNCFNQHSFQELNSIDYDLLKRVITIFGKQFNITSNSSPIFFDVGCNGGSFVRAVRDCGYTNTIHCFEPHPVLSKTVSSRYSNLKMNEFCLTNKNEKVVIHIPMLSCGISSLIDRPVFKTLNQPIVAYETRGVMIDTYCRENEIEMIDFIKIDVEGAEKIVLEGAKEMLRNKKIKAGLFEHGSTLTDAGTSTQEIVSMLEGFGYRCNPYVDKANIYFSL